MGAAERSLGLRTRLERVALGEEAVPLDLWRHVGEKRVVARGLRHRGLDLARRVGGALAGVDRDTAVDRAPGGHRGGPVAALDPAHVEVDRVVEFREMRMGRLAGVPLRLERAQRGDHPEARLDGVRAGARLADMNRPARDADAKPQHAAIGAHELFVLRLGDQRGVGPVAPRHARQRAVARAFLLDHRLQMDRGGGLKTDPPKRVEREEIGGEPGFHVGRPAPVEPVALAARAERRRGPERGRSLRHDVDMAVEDQRTPRLGARTMRGDDIQRVGVIDRHGREAGMIADRVEIDRPDRGGVAARAKGAGHRLLRGLLAPAQRRAGHEFLEKGDLIAEPRRDRVQYPRRQAGARLSHPRGPRARAGPARRR